MCSAGWRRALVTCAVAWRWKTGALSHPAVGGPVEPAALTATEKGYLTVTSCVGERGIHGGVDGEVLRGEA